HAHYAALAGLEGLQGVIERLKTELAAAQDAPLTCLLSLGWGTGFVAKAGLLETENTSYRKILRATPAIGKGLRENLPFPKTRRVVFVQGKPASLPGWVKLQFTQ